MKYCLLYCRSGTRFKDCMYKICYSQGSSSIMMAYRSVECAEKYVPYKHIHGKMGYRSMRFGNFYASFQSGKKGPMYYKFLSGCMHITQSGAIILDGRTIKLTTVKLMLYTLKKK